MSRVLRSVKNVVKNYTEAEIMTREATSNDAWFCSQNLLNDISRYTFHPVSLYEIHAIIAKRLNDNGKNWRHIAKSLILFEHIAFHGSDKVYDLLCQSSILISTLNSFAYIDKEGKDHGAVIREKSRRLMQLINDKKFFEAERAKMKEMASNSNSYYADSRRVPMDAERPYYVPPGGSAVANSGLLMDVPKSREEEEANLRLALAISKQEAENAGVPSTQPDSTHTLDFLDERRMQMQKQLMKERSANSSSTSSSKQSPAANNRNNFDYIDERKQQLSTQKRDMGLQNKSTSQNVAAGPVVNVRNDAALLEDIFSSNQTERIGNKNLQTGVDPFSKLQQQANDPFFTNSEVMPNNNSSGGPAKQNISNDPFASMRQNYSTHPHSNQPFPDNSYGAVQQNYSGQPIPNNSYGAAQQNYSGQPIPNNSYGVAQQNYSGQPIPNNSYGAAQQNYSGQPIPNNSYGVAQQNYSGQPIPNNSYGAAQQNYSGQSIPNNSYGAAQQNYPNTANSVNLLDKGGLPPRTEVRSPTQDSFLGQQDDFFKRNLDLIGNPHGCMHPQRSNPFEPKKDKGLPINELIASQRQGSDSSTVNFNTNNHQQQSPFSNNTSQNRDPFGL